MEKKFYQKYVVAEKEEAFVILKEYIKGFCGENPKDGYLDEHICNVFVKEYDFGTDKLDTSCCYIVSEGLYKSILRWADCNNLKQVPDLEGFDYLDEGAIINSLYEKLIGSSNMDTLYKEDYKIFGSGVSWYKDDVLFQKFWNLTKN